MLNNNQELLEWHRSQLAIKNMKIENLSELSTGYYFIEILHNYHSKFVDLTKIYLKPKSKYEILQNYKHLVHIFNKLGWKKFDPQKLSTQSQKQYLGLAKYLKKELTSKLKQDNNNVQQQEEGDYPNMKIVKDRNLKISKNNRIIELENIKKNLLNKIIQIQNIVNSTDDVKLAKNQIQIILNKKSI